LIVGSVPMTNSTSGYITGSGIVTVEHLTNEGHVGVDDGNMTLEGGLTNDSTVDVQPDAVFTVYGPTDGSGSFSGTGTVILLGNVSPGSSPGELSFGGDLVLAGSTLYMELGGTEAGEDCDRMVVVGEIAVGGVLEVAWWNDWRPSAGDVFDLLEFGSVTGAFSDVVLPDLDGELTWDTSALYTTGDVMVVPEPATLALAGLGGVCLLWRRRR